MAIVAPQPLQLPDCNGRPTCDPVPVCPACGGLECLCRPRFFAGQLLTEEDLNRLDYYIQAKNRLHNRYLHGWGVACGLEVLLGECSPDQRQLIVNPGYALSPCGNDIIVCRTETVDVCDLINRCRPPVDCADMFAPPASPPTGGGAVQGPLGPFAPAAAVPDCPAGTEEWVLAICYSEKPSRGVAVLRASVPACGCGCAGCTAAGCGCGGNGSKGHGGGGGCGCKGPMPTAPRTMLAHPVSRSRLEQCEPTVLCEGYSFVVYKIPKIPKKTQGAGIGAAWRRFLCCLAPFINEVGQVPPNLQVQEAQQWLMKFRDAVREFLVNEGLYDGEILQQLTNTGIPQVVGLAPAAAMVELTNAAAALSTIAVSSWQKCLCAAFLPPCPDPSQTDCVPLATVTVTRERCRVVRVCNIGARKFLVTIPNIAYWLSFFSSQSTGVSLWQQLEELCCRSRSQLNLAAEASNFFGTPGEDVPPAGDESAPRAAAAGTGSAGGSPLGSLFWRAIGAPGRNVGVEHLLLGALGVRDAAGKPFASAEELAHPSEFLVLNRIVAPLVRTLVPPPSTLGALAAGLVAAQPEATRVEGLEQEVAGLRATVTRLQRAINEARRKP